MSASKYTGDSLKGLDKMKASKYTCSPLNGTKADGWHMASSPLIVTPAYGRVYKTESELLEDWKAGKDFKIKGGPYCSIRDIEALQHECSSLWCVDLVSKLNVQLG